MPEARPDTPHDTEQVAQIVREYGAMVWRVLRGYGLGDTEIDDACQEVFLIVLRKFGTFEGRSSLSTWLYSIASNVARRTRERRAKERRLREKAEAVPVDSQTPLASLESRQQLARLDQALGELDEAKRTVFVLFEIEELPMSEVSQIAGCNLSTAYTRLYAAREHIAHALEKDDRPRIGNPQRGGSHER
jgi:RNA polymerase sigma-70 factor (ECF subfamily)